MWFARWIAHIINCEQKWYICKGGNKNDWPQQSQKGTPKVLRAKKAPRYIGATGEESAGLDIGRRNQKREQQRSPGTSEPPGRGPAPSRCSGVARGESTAPIKRGQKEGSPEH
ncbi:hypothetical protein C5O22_07600 [Treponema sp. J25]|nr:hypothetical protein C5O22_07600 [Treponema sp. J25]